jgi:hypothetical protein
VKRLNLSEGSVCRKTQVAGMCRRYPRILEALSDGRLNLTTTGLIAPHLRPDNVERPIAEAEGKTKRELESFLVTLKPKERFKPSIRKQHCTAQKHTEHSNAVKHDTANPVDAPGANNSGEVSRE